MYTIYTIELRVIGPHDEDKVRENVREAAVKLCATSGEHAIIEAWSHDYIVGHKPIDIEVTNNYEFLVPYTP